MARAPSTGGLEMGDQGFLRVNARLEGEQLQPGECSLSENGRMDRGVWQQRLGIQNLSGALQNDADPLLLPFFLVDTPGGLAVDSAERTGELVVLTLSHSFPPESYGWLGLSGLTGTVDPNGQRFMYEASGTTVNFLIPGAVGSETYSGSGLVANYLDDGAASRIWGSCLFSDPSSGNDESIIVAATGKAFKIPVDGSAVSEVSYPTGLNLEARADLLQDFDRITLFQQDGERSWEWFPNGRAVSAAALASNVVTVTLNDHGLTTGDTVVLASIGFATTNPNGSRVVTGTPSKDTFTFALTGGDETYSANTGTASAGFTLCKGGAYTQPQVFEATGTDVVVTSGLATITITGNTTIKAGDPVRIYSTDAADFLEFVGRSYVATTASTTAVSFYIPAKDLATISSSVISIGKEVSQGSGFIHMPAPPWGVNHQRRRFVPYWYSTGGTALAPTYTDRDIRDEIVISDILDGDTYDVLTNQFRITGGVADFTVGMHPFYDDTMLVFQRNSIHGIFGVSGSLADISAKELTREIGLLARKSLAQYASQVLFLSDNGVYSLGFFDQYNLRPVGLPLSEPIQPYIDRINPNLAAESVGVYFSNRYYLAVPLDSARGANDATGNNSVLVYNFLNEGWESVDSVSDGRWNVLNFHIARAGERNDLYAVDGLGGVHKLDAVDRDSDFLTLAPGDDPSYFPVQSRLQTREYDGQTLERKRFIEVQAMVESAGQAIDADFSFTTEDPDSTTDLSSISTELGAPLTGSSTASLRKRVGGFRGQGGTVTITPTAGRPKVKSVKVTASVTNKATTWQR